MPANTTTPPTKVPEAMLSDELQQQLADSSLPIPDNLPVPVQIWLDICEGFASVADWCMDGLMHFVSYFQPSFAFVFDTGFSFFEAYVSPSLSSPITFALLLVLVAIRFVRSQA